MAKGFKQGSGGTSLNFVVLAYATEEELNAATPKENTIGVVTTDKITAWDFSVTQPTAPEEGMVWIVTASASTASFNALKKNSLQVYPISAKQYTGGAWADREVEIYINGAWVPLMVYLVKKGVPQGTLKSKKLSSLDYGQSISSSSSGGTFTIKATATSSGYGSEYLMYFDGFTSVDLTNVKEIIYEGTISYDNPGTNFRRLAVYKTLSGASSTNAVQYIDISSGTTKLGVSSLSGEYCIGIWNCTTKTTTYNITNLYLK